MGRTALVVAAALSAVACAGITGLADYEVVNASAAASDGGSVILDGGVTLSPTTLAFPEARCGETKTLTLVITNPTSAAVVLTVTPPAGITVEGATGSVPANGAVTLSVNASAGTTGPLRIGVGDGRFDVTVTTAFRGTRLSVDPSSLDFGEVRHDTTSAPRGVAVTNDGDEDVSIVGLTPADDFALEKQVLVPARGKATASIVMKSRPAGDPITANVALAADKPICTPAELVLKGRRFPGDVSVPTALDLPCSTSPTLTLSNAGAKPASFVVKAPAALNVTPTTGQISASSAAGPGTFPLVVSRGSSDPLVDTTFEVVVSEDGLPARTFAVRVHPFGAILEYDDSTIQMSSEATVTRPVVNTGNTAACIHYAIVNSGGGGGFVVEPDERFEPNVPGDFKVKAPASTGPNARGRLQLSAVPCAGTPAATPICNSLREIELKVDD